MESVQKVLGSVLKVAVLLLVGVFAGMCLSEHLPGSGCGCKTCPAPKCDRCPKTECPKCGGCPKTTDEWKGCPCPFGCRCYEGKPCECGDSCDCTGCPTKPGCCKK
jgi:hypothetical protein